MDYELKTLVELRGGVNLSVFLLNTSVEVIITTVSIISVKDTADLSEDPQEDLLASSARGTLRRCLFNDIVYYDVQLFWLG